MVAPRVYVLNHSVSFPGPLSGGDDALSFRAAYEDNTGGGDARRELSRVPRR